ncbi:DUF3006 domain-containing protein [Pseudalkalibacillus sp. A8]|uniref:DUF3006 domain-containing protein n=1 Tax=Pseudalkalibacillus sp. A8 TaxID=3382641 RepID=UPI0038B62D39
MHSQNKYTVDRFEGDLVVLLMKGNESVQKDVPIHQFPKDIAEGDIVKEESISGKIRYKILHDETDDARKKVNDLLNNLINKNKR